MLRAPWTSGFGESGQCPDLARLCRPEHGGGLHAVGRASDRFGAATLDSVTKPSPGRSAAEEAPALLAEAVIGQVAPGIGGEFGAEPV